MPRRNPPPGGPTPLPTVSLDLGRYVTVRPPLDRPPKKDGTRRVLFEVPARLRPSGWSATIPLPLKGPRTGKLDAGEVARIRADADDLLRKLQIERRGGGPDPRARSFANLIDAWKDSDDWTTLKPKSKKHYEVYIRNVEAWSKANGDPDPTTLTPDAIGQFLKLFDAQPVTKKNTLKVIRLLMRQAVLLNWRKDNPAREIKVKVPKTKASIWEQADVDAYVAEANRQGRRSLAVIILMEWEIGQRLTDVRAFRPGVEYDASTGVFSFEQSKTGNAVTIPVSSQLRDSLNGEGDGELFLFRNDVTGLAFTEHALSHAFGKVRRDVVKAGGRPLLLRWLRHSCVVQLARAGCTVPQIAAVTGHSPSGAANILSTYLPRDGAVALEAQKRRGLVNV